MIRNDSANGQVSVGGLLLLGIVSVQVAFALMIIVALASEHPDSTSAKAISSLSEM